MSNNAVDMWVELKGWLTDVMENADDYPYGLDASDVLEVMEQIEQENL